MKLDPEERAHLVCVIKGIDTIRRDGKLPKADRLKSSITRTRGVQRYASCGEGRRGARQVALV